MPTSLLLLTALVVSGLAAVCYAVVLRARRHGAGLLIAMVIAFVASTQPAHAANVQLQLFADCQLKSNWCWVAAAQSIIDYHGPKYLQCTIYKWGKNVSTCDGDLAGSITTDLDRVFTAAGMRTIGVATAGNVSFETIVLEINANRPLLARMAWNSSNTAHMMPIRGYNNDGGLKDVRYVHIKGCPDATNYMITSYANFAVNGNWTWNYTRKGMS